MTRRPRAMPDDLLGIARGVALGSLIWLGLLWWALRFIRERAA